MATSNNQGNARAFSALVGHQYMSLTTFRKNGNPVPTPVWFAQRDDKLYVMTLSDAYKVARVRANAQVEVAPCTMRGELLGSSAEAMARVLDDAEGKSADQALTQKYGLMKRLFAFASRVRGGKYVYLEITPM